MSARDAMKSSAVLLALGLLVSVSSAQVLQEDFDAVTGSGGGGFFSGAGFGQIAGWDDGILGENAFAGTAGNARFGLASAFGSPGSGVAGSGAGVLDLSAINFNLLDESFNGVSGSGGGVFLLGDGTPDTFNFTLNWDNALENEGAFAGTANGAVLLGSVSAQALTTGGSDGLGGGQLVVDNVQLNSGTWFAGLQWTVGSLPGISPLVNPGFEDGIVGAGLSGWTTFGNVFTEAIAPRSGAQHAKMFGTFSGPSGFFQNFPAQPGQTWQIDGFARTNSNDTIFGGGNSVEMKIEFLDSSSNVILDTVSVILDGSSPQDIWVNPAPVQLVAPAGTVAVQAVFVFVQSGFEGGAAFIDDVSFGLAGQTASLSDFSLSAQIRGAANGAAGETLGNYQLRIEDADGDRLIFSGLADGTFQTVGGTLDTAIEADPNGNPAPGVFNLDSPQYVVVAAFDNDAANAWGSGGTLEIDNLVFTNPDSSGSDWFGGLFWDNLTLPAGATLDSLALTADVLGSVPGGAYELRLEGLRLTSAGLNEDFSTATGVGGGLILDPNQVAGGTTFGFSDDWDTGIEGEGAFGGLFGLIDVLPGGGISAQAVIGGGLTDNAGEIRVRSMVPGPGGGWFAGLNWSNQGLASTDLSQVTLSADIRGLDLEGFFGDYELRIEDEQGDRLFFSATADGTWQHIGGTLDTATEGAALGGGGDGTFNLDSNSYAVAVAFINPENTWIFGGALQVDNLFLTPVQLQREVGRVSFDGVSDGTFQSIGGVLSSGIGTFGEFDQGFDSATGVGGMTFTDGGVDDWDTGITGEHAFFGTFGNAVVNGGATAQACTTCGVGGGSAGQIIVSDVPPGGGGWFAGVFFDTVRADLGGDISQVMLTADIAGTANSGAGESLGTYFIRIEDEDLTVLSFTVTADGSFQSVGGPLSTATLEQINSGDGVFNFNQQSYTVTVGFVGTSSNWGPGGTLTVDNLFLTGVSLADADAFNVTLAFKDEVNTWGTDGTLTVDNLNLGDAVVCPADITGDNQVTLADLAILLANFGTPSGAAFEDGDLDGDGDVDLGDLAVMLSAFGTLCS